MSTSPSDADGTILVPIANRETADRQLDTAIDIAADRSYRVLLVYVLDVPSQLSLEDGRRYLLADEDGAMLETAAKRVESNGIPVDHRIRIARGVATGIVGAAEAYDVDVVLLGWRGRPPRENIVLGNHLDKVLKNAECDVLVKRIKTPTPPTIDSILVPVAGGPHDELAAETADSIARRNDASISLLHVLDPDDPELTLEEAEVFLAETADWMGNSRSVNTKIIENADVSGAITDSTTKHDITVLGASRGGLIQRALVGTVSEAVGRHAAGTVILTKRYDPVRTRIQRLLRVVRILDSDVPFERISA
ncbi:universal stress protein [Halostagnicola bangensis]